MASTNQSPEYQAAEKKYSLAQTDEEILAALEEMIRYAPKHKAGESMRANLKMRYVKLKDKIQSNKEKKKASRGKEGIKKEGIQVALIGFTNSGKSSLLSVLTNAKPEIAEYDYTTKEPVIGTLIHDGIHFQIIDMPAADYENFDQGTTNTADILLLLIKNIQEIEQIYPFIEKSIGRRIILITKMDLLSPDKKRKTESFLRSKKYNFCFTSTKTGEGIAELKNKLIENSGAIRIYTKEPGKPVSPEPVIFRHEPNVKELADKIFKGLSSQVKETRVTGPSSKFPNQKVGLDHVLKDKDIVEFKTR